MILVPAFTASLQSPDVPAPQAIPVPATEPFTGVGETVRVGLANVTATVASAFTVTSQVVPVPAQPPPLQDSTA